MAIYLAAVAAHQDSPAGASPQQSFPIATNFVRVQSTQALPFYRFWMKKAIHHFWCCCSCRFPWGKKAPQRRQARIGNLLTSIVSPERQAVVTAFERWFLPLVVCSQRGGTLDKTRMKKSKNSKTKIISPAQIYEPDLIMKAWRGNVVCGGGSTVPVPVQGSKRRHLPYAIDAGSKLSRLNKAPCVASLAVEVEDRSIAWLSTAVATSLFKVSLKEENQFELQEYEQEKTQRARVKVAGALGGSSINSRASDVCTCSSGLPLHQFYQQQSKTFVFGLPTEAMNGH